MGQFLEPHVTIETSGNDAINKYLGVRDIHMLYIVDNTDDYTVQTFVDLYRLLINEPHFSDDTDDHILLKSAFKKIDELLYMVIN